MGLVMSAGMTAADETSKTDNEQEPKTVSDVLAQTPTSKPDPTDDLVTTHHVLKSVDGDLAYSATIGRIVIKEETVKDDKFEGRKPKAEISVTYYTLDPKNDETPDLTKRPVVFAFNGGPGSSSVWLHMGVLGPRRVDMGDAGNLTPPPYGLLDNPETLLRVADLVFIDPISTGFSRATEGESAKDYHGFTGDIEQVGEVIRLWTTRNGRWMSPKFILGESYGGTRAAALVDYLQNRYGMYFNGVIMVAPALNLETLFHAQNSDLPYPMFLPVYAAVAHYHNVLPEGVTLEEAVAKADDYVDEYRTLLAKGNKLTPEEFTAAAAKLAEITGLSQEYIEESNLRVTHVRYLAELLRHRRQVVGRLDARFTGPALSYVNERLTFDPFGTATEGSFTAAWNHYIHDELGYKNDLAYETTTDKVRPWSYKEFEGSSVDMVDKMSSAMIVNPHLQVQVALGRYDAGVPKEAVEYTLDHLTVPDEAKGRIETLTYPAGHMMYLHQPSRVKQLGDFAEFIKKYSNR